MGRVWTKEKVEMLKSLCKANLNRRQIADAMDTTVDAVKNAIERYKLLKFYNPSTVQKLDKINYGPLQDLDESDFEDLKEKARIKWTPAKSSRKKAKKKKFKIYLVTSDHHIPEQDDPALKAIFQLMDDVSFDGNIILGDFMDMAPISHWTKNKRKTMESRRLKEDYLIGNAILDEFDKRLPKGCDKRFFYGNHEDWYFQLIEEMPELDDLFSPKTALQLEERGYTVYENLNHVEKIGKLALTHGMYTPQNFVKKHIDEFKTNVMFGHLHSPRIRCEASVGHRINMIGYCLGCLCHKNPDYMKNKPNKWAHGFAVLYVYDDGMFDVDLKRIIDGKFIYNNKLYNGNV